MKTGIIAGAFDIIHPGYIKAFKEAKHYCDRLVVCVHIDPSIERPEKPKPVLSVFERSEILESIKYVDDVVFYRLEEDFLHLLDLVKPDVRFLGQDYSIGIKAITGAELNIPIVYLDRSHGWSETKLKKMIYGTIKTDEWVEAYAGGRCRFCAEVYSNGLNKSHICQRCFAEGNR